MRKCIGNIYLLTLLAFNKIYTNRKCLPDLRKHVKTTLGVGRRHCVLKRASLVTPESF